MYGAPNLVSLLPFSANIDLILVTPAFRHFVTSEENEFAKYFCRIRNAMCLIILIL